jgi:hypothetical protein
MKKMAKPYNVFHHASAIFMMFALLWLTISLPFVLASNQQMDQQDNFQSGQSTAGCTEEETSNPLGNATEEKAPTSSSASEEYLHNNHVSEYFFSIISPSHKCENSNIYDAFHGEVQVPPPNVS